MIIKRLLASIAVLLVVGISASTLSLNVRAITVPTPPDTSGQARSVILYCAEADRILAERDADIPIRAGATVKMALALAAIRMIERSDALSLDSVATAEASSASNRLDPPLASGEKISLSSLLAAVILRGAEDASSALIRAVTSGLADNGTIPAGIPTPTTPAGRTAGIVEAADAIMTAEMNALAAELGMTATLYTSPANESISTTARDALLLAKAALGNYVYTDIAGCARIVIPATNLNAARNVYNANHMLSTYVFPSDDYGYYTPEVIGLSANDRNTGAAANGGEGGTLAATARIGALTYICVVLGGNAADNRHLEYFKAAKTLFSWGARAYRYTDVSGDLALAGELPVRYGDGRDYVTVESEGSLRLFLPSDADLTMVLYEKIFNVKSLSAPVEAGTVVGSVRVILDGEIIGEVPLVTKYGVGYSVSAHTAEAVRHIFLGPAAITLYTLSVLGVIGLILAAARYRYVHRPRVLVRTARGQTAGGRIAAKPSDRGSDDRGPRG